MNAADRRRMTPPLAILAVVLVLVLVALWLGAGRSVHWWDTASAPRLPSPDSNLPAPENRPLDRYAEVWQRPLFSPTRTPEAPGSTDGGASGDLELTGVIMLPGLKMAIVHDKTHNKDYRLVSGKATAGAPTLVELQPRSAVVEAAGSRLQLHLLPGPSPDVGHAQGPGAPQPAASAGVGASGIVTRHGGARAGSRMRAAEPQDEASAAARARQLKARVEADRRRAARRQGSSG